MSNVVTYKNGCPKNKASLAMIQQFGERAHLDELKSLEDALSRGKVFAWETGWIGYEIMDKGDDRIFWIISIFNDTNKGMYSTEKNGKWFWKKFVALAKEEKCNKMKFQTKRFGIAKWASRFGFTMKKIIMEIDL